ncbi:uncharacterized protein IL334_004890 [Kwoniella shivajii]|uniref:Inositol-pentakisphosphate 2-kinase n=1 Tax=Kwoniella shivajii TaxID=564305 RepID=A0ABZ1D1L5_9TREE|nr:hypothetical protein IL334_004890 [Kwoniella shivajii]
MVSLLSLFQSKKKGKKVKSRSPSPSPSPSPIAPSSNGKGSTRSQGGSSRPSRFLSLRHKSTSSSSKPHEYSKRRTSGEISRKKSSIKSNQFQDQGQTKTKIQPDFIPKLDLGFDIGSERKNDEFGIHTAGEIIALNEEEKDVLTKIQLTVDEVKSAWEVIGKSLRESDLHTFGLMFPLQHDTDLDTQRYIFALFALSNRPELSSKLPTISAQFAQTASNAATEWRERLSSILKDVNNPTDLAGILKNTLRHLRPSLTPPEPLIDLSTYTTFVQAEHASSYPLDVYHTLLLPNLKTGTADFLNELFEVWSVIVAHAEENTMTPGRLAYLLGFWSCGLGIEKYENWRELYKNWKIAGARMEHLLYAWIRYQSVTTQIPTRLLELVDKYPFGEASASSKVPPSPPPSSFPRHTLHLSLTSSTPLSEILSKPGEILQASLSAKMAQDASLPLWSSISTEKVDLSDLVAEDSLKFLKTITRDTDLPSNNPKIIENKTPSPPVHEPLYRPFSTISAGSTSRIRHHSHSGGIPSPTDHITSSPTLPNFLSYEPMKQEGDSPKSVKKQASLGVLPQGGGSAWDDFQKTGFGDSPKTFSELALAFSPKSTASTSPKTPDVRSEVNGTRPVMKKRTTFNDSKVPTPVYSITEEEVIEIDDLFMAFAEDAQLDPTSVALWPPFSLVRLASPLSSFESNKKIEWLLVTVTHKAAPPPEFRYSPEFDHTRPTSPSSSKPGTPRGFRGITESFKRSTSFQSGMALRKSFFGNSSFTLSRHTSDELSPLPESETSNAHALKAPLSAQSLTPTEYTITEMGEMIKIPSASDKVPLIPLDPTPEISEATIDDPARDPVVITMKTPHRETTISSGPSADSLYEDWQYFSEGAEHIVFSYRGSSPKYVGQVLRLRKSQFTVDASSDPEYKQTREDWSSKLLPKLLPENLLLHTEHVNIAQKWLENLLEAAEELRPVKRRAVGALTGLVNGDGHGMLVEDTTINEKGDGLVNLAFEIKPKWGFLPSSSAIQPREVAEIKSHNCRFCMTRHRAGYDVTSEARYCPLDLYSGDGERIKQAIKGLWGIWEESGAKENNWRIFVDSQFVSPDKVTSIPSFGDGENLVDDVAALVAPILLSSRVFVALKSLQSTLDPTDISDLASRFSDAYPDMNLFDPSLIPFPTFSELDQFVDLYLSSPQSGKGDSWTLRERLIAFALSAIFKDCSIFVKLTLQSSTSSHDDKDGKVEWKLVDGSGTVKIIDLDLKPIHNLKTWKERDDKIWKYWLEHPPHPTSPIVAQCEGREGLKNEESEHTVSGESGERVEQEKSDDGKEEHNHLLDIPLQSKITSGVLNSDGSSIQALLIATPDQTRSNTPFPVPSAKHTHPIQDQDADITARNDESDEQKSMPEFLVREVDESRREKRSLAPSPSPSLPSTEEQKDIKDESPVGILAAATAGVASLVSLVVGDTIASDQEEKHGWEEESKFKKTETHENKDEEVDPASHPEKEVGNPAPVWTGLQLNQPPSTAREDMATPLSEAEHFYTPFDTPMMSRVHTSDQATSVKNRETNNILEPVDCKREVLAGTVEDHNDVKNDQVGQTDLASNPGSPKHQTGSLVDDTAIRPRHLEEEFTQKADNIVPKQSTLLPLLGHPIHTDPTDAGYASGGDKFIFDNNDMTAQPRSSAEGIDRLNHLQSNLSDSTPISVEEEEERYIPHHDLSTISEDGESSRPTSTSLSRGDAVSRASERGEQWVEDVIDSEEETPQAMYEHLSEVAVKANENSEKDQYASSQEAKQS